MGGEEAGGGKTGSRKGKKNDSLPGKVSAGNLRGAAVRRNFACKPFPDLLFRFMGKRTGLLL